MENSTVKTAMSEELAIKEVNGWLDNMGFTPKELESDARKADIDRLVSGIMYGTITIDSNTDNVTQVLKFPAGEVKQLVYNADTDIGTVNSKMKGAKMDMSIIAYSAAAYTNQPTAIIEKLKRGDAKTMKAILGFFM